MKKTVMVILIESVHDPVRYAEYIAAVKAIVEQHGGEYIARSNKITAFCGTIKPERSIVIGFDSLAQAESCFNSPEYRAVKHLREDSTVSSAFFIDND